MFNGCNRGWVLTEYSSTGELSEYGGFPEIDGLQSRDGGNSSKRIFLKNIDFLVKTFFKDNYLQKNLYEDAASEEIFTLYTREEYNLGRIILKDFFKPV